MGLIESNKPTYRSSSGRPASDTWFRNWILGFSCALIVTTAWSLASPVGSAPDSAFHLASIWCSDTASLGSCPIIETIPDHERAYLPVELIYPSCFQPLPNGSTACEIGLSDHGLASVRPNQLTNLNPSGFYSALGAVAGEPINQRVVLMRTLSGAFAVTLISLSALLLHARERARFIFIATAMHIPLGLFFAASINSSGAATAAVISAVPLGLRLQRARGAAELLALVSGSFLLIWIATGIRKETYLFVALIITTLIAPRIIDLYRRAQRRGMVRIGLIVTCMVAFSQLSGTIGFIRAVLRGFLRSSPESEIGVGLILNNGIGVFLLWTAAVGGGAPKDVAGLGQLDVAVSPLVPALVVTAIVLTIFRSQRETVQRSWIPAFALIWVAWLLPFWTLTVSGLHVGEQLQPRYILPILAAGVILAALGETPSDAKWRPIGRFELISLVVAHSLALQAVISHYSFRGSTLGAKLRATPAWEWSVIDPRMNWVVGTFAFAVFASTLRSAGKHDIY